MDDCYYCDEFNPLWKKLTKQIKKLKMSKRNKDDCPELLQKYDISSFPSLILQGKNTFKDFEDEKSISNIKKFLQNNTII